jgi:multidrug resistance efflux pump
MSEEILIQGATPAERLTTIQAEVAAIDRAAEGFTGRLTQAKADLLRIDSDLSALRVRRGDSLAAGEDPKTIDKETTQVEKERRDLIDLIGGCERALERLKGERLPKAAELTQVQAAVDAAAFAGLVDQFNETVRAAGSLMRRITAVSPSHSAFAGNLTEITLDGKAAGAPVWRRGH